MVIATRGRRLRLAAGSVSLALLALSTGPAGAGGSALSMGDPSGDANGLNDGGEGVVGDIPGGVSVPQADLRRVEVDALRDPDGQTYGFTVTFATEAAPAPVTSSPRLDTTYSLLMQPTPDCRLSVQYVATGRRSGSGGLNLSNSCSLQHRTVPLESVRSGRTVTVFVPYRLTPTQLRAGEQVEQYYASTRAGFRMLDTDYSRGSFTLPR